MDQATLNMLMADTWRALAILTGTDASYQLPGEPTSRLEVNVPAQQLRAILEGVQTLVSRPPVAVDADALAAALAANDAFIGKVAAAVAAHIEPSLTLTEVGDWLAMKFATKGQA